MPMPDFVGWNQEQQASRARSADTANTLTNMMIKQQEAPIHQDYMKAQTEYMRAHAGQAQAAAQKLALRNQLLPLVANDPDSMIKLGVALGDAQLIQEGERQKKQKAESGALSSLQSQPDAQQASSLVDSPRPLGPSDIPTNEYAAFMKATQPGFQGTVQGSAQPTFGGALRPQMESQNPAISQQATQVQSQVDRMRPGAMPIASVEGMVNRVSQADQALQNRQPPRPETPVPIIGPDGQARYVPSSQAYGQTPASMASRGDAINPANAHLTGDEYIKTLPPGMRNIVRGLVTYQLPLTVLSARAGERQQAYEHAAQADPSFDIKKYPQRQKVVNDFTSGKTADNLVAIDQAINHMGTLDTLGDALKNGNVQAINAVTNEIKKQLGDPKVTNFNTAKQAVGEELMRVFRQVQASEIEVKDWKANFDTKNSPEQIRGSLQTASKLLEGRLNAINERWNRGMDTDTGYPKIMSPQAGAAFSKLIGTTPSASAWIDRAMAANPGMSRDDVEAEGRRLGKIK